MIWRDFFMEEIGKIHQLMLKNRNRGSVTGVTDVISFDENRILLETIQGMLTIEGTELHVSRLQLEAGEVDVEGTVKSLVYMDGKAGKKQRGSLMKRLFQ